MIDPAKLEGAITQGFGLFDKDKSGFIEAAEVTACVRKVLSLGGLTHINDQQINSVFAKFAGTDGKLDKAEFQQLVHQLLSKVGGHHGAPAAGASSGGTPAADPHASK